MRDDEPNTTAVVRQMTESEKSYYETALTTLSLLDDRDGKQAGMLESPLIGTLTTPDCHAYAYQLMHLGNTIEVELNATPDGKRASWWLEYRMKQLMPDVSIPAQ